MLRELYVKLNVALVNFIAKRFSMCEAQSLKAAGYILSHPKVKEVFLKTCKEHSPIPSLPGSKRFNKNYKLMLKLRTVMEEVANSLAMNHVYPMPNAFNNAQRFVN